MSGWQRILQAKWFPYAVAGFVTVIGVGLLIWCALPNQPTNTYRGREFRDLTVCLLTDSRGESSAEAAPVWAGLQDASLRALVRVQAHKIARSQRPADADASVNTLVLRHCQMIVAVGELASSAVQRAAGTYPTMQFVIVGPGTSSTNVTVVEQDATDLSGQIAGIVLAQVGAPS